MDFCINKHQVDEMIRFCNGLHTVELLRAAYFSWTFHHIEENKFLLDLYYNRPIQDHLYLHNRSSELEEYFVVRFGLEYWNMIRPKFYCECFLSDNIFNNCKYCKIVHQTMDEHMNWQSPPIFNSSIPDANEFYSYIFNNLHQNDGHIYIPKENSKINFTDYHLTDLLSFMMQPTSHVRIYFYKLSLFLSSRILVSSLINCSTFKKFCIILIHDLTTEQQYVNRDAVDYELNGRMSVDFVEFENDVDNLLLNKGRILYINYIAPSYWEDDYFPGYEQFIYLPCCSHVTERFGKDACLQHVTENIITKCSYYLSNKILKANAKSTKLLHQQLTRQLFKDSDNLVFNQEMNTQNIHIKNVEEVKTYILENKTKIEWDVTGLNHKHIVLLKRFIQNYKIRTNLTVINKIHNDRKINSLVGDQNKHIKRTFNCKYLHPECITLFRNFLKENKFYGIKLVSDNHQLTEKNRQKKRKIDRDIKNENNNQFVFTQEMFTCFNKAKDSAYDFLSRVDQVPSKMNAAFDCMHSSFETTKEQVSELVSKISKIVDDSFASFKSNFTANWETIKSWLCFLIIALLAIWLPSSFYKVIQLMISLPIFALLCAKPAIVSSIINMIDMCRELYNSTTSNLDSSPNVVFTQEINTPFESCLPDFPHALFSLFFMILTYFFIDFVPDTKAWNNFMYKCDKIPRAIKGFQESVQYISEWFKYIEDYIFRVVVDNPSYVTTFTEISEVDLWINKVQKYSNHEYQEKALKIKTELEIMIRLVEEGQNLLIKGKNRKWDSNVLNIIGRFINISELLKQKAISTGRLSSLILREKPTVIHLVGGTSVGKTFVTKYLAIDLMAMDGIKKEDALHNIWYSRVKCEHKDGYVGQHTTVIDEFSMIVDSVNSPNEQFIDLIDMANNAHLDLPMAELSLKGNTRFVSKVLFTTTNNTHLSNLIKSITYKPAIYSRMDLAFYVTIAPEFQVDPTADPFTGDPLLTRLNTAKVGSTNVDLSVWRFYKFDPSKGEPLIDEYYDFYEVSRMCKEKHKFNQQKSNSANTNIYKYIDESYARYEAEQALFNQEIKSQYEDAEDLPFAFELKDQNHFHLTYLKALKNGVERERVDAHPDVLAMYEMQLKYHKALVKIDQTDAIEFLDYDNETQENEIEWTDEDESKLEMLYRIASKCWNYVKEKYNQFQSYIDVKYPFYTILTTWVPAIFAVIASALALHSLFTYFVGGSQLADYSATDFDFDNNLYLKLKETNIPSQYYHLIVNGQKSSQPVSYVDKTYPAYKTTLSCLKCKISRRYFFMDEFPRCANCYSVMKNLCHDVHGNYYFHNNGKADLDIGAFKNEIGLQSVFRQEENEKGAQCYRDSLNYISNNIMKLQYLTQKNEWVSACNIIAIGGYVYIVNKHVNFFLKQYNTRIKLVHPNLPTGFEFNYNECKVIEPECTKNRDFVAIVVPAKYNIRQKKITQHFITESDWSCIKKLKNTNITGNLTTIISSNHFQSIPVTHCKYQEQTRTYSKEFNKEEIFHNTVVYNSSTTVGDCGAPLMFNNRYISGIIAGIHGGSINGIGMSHLITREDISAVLSSVDKIDKFTWSEKATFELEANIMKNGFTGSNLPIGEFVPICKLPYTISQSPKNKIVPSKFHDKIIVNKIHYPPLKLPSQLGFGRDENGIKVDLKLKALSKMGNGFIVINQKLLDLAGESYFQKVKDLKPEWKEKRLLSIEESIIGVDGSEYNKGCNRKSSLGWPYNIPGTKFHGKRDHFGTDEWTLDTSLAKEMILKVKSVLKGYLDLTGSALIMFTDTLKMEKLPISKVLDNKTRQFSAGPFEFYCVFQVLCGSFINALKCGKIDVECCVGVNPYGFDVNKIVYNLTTKGNNMIAGDFSRFDASVNKQAIYKIFELINKWYNDEYSDVRMALADDLVNSLHVNGNQVYMWTHSQPSGQPATAEINSIFLSLMYRMACFDIMGPTFDFNKYVGLVTYGDDSVASFPDHLIHLITYKSLSDAFTRLGMEFTDEQKNTIFGSQKKITELSFLKRDFEFNDNINRWTMKLNKDTIREMVQWHPESLDQDEQLVLNCQTALREMSLHGEQEFNQLRDCLEDLADKNDIHLTYDTYGQTLLKLLHLDLPPVTWDPSLSL